MESRLGLGRLVAEIAARLRLAGWVPGRGESALDESEANIDFVLSCDVGEQPVVSIALVTERVSSECDRGIADNASQFSTSGGGAALGRLPVLRHFGGIDAEQPDPLVLAVDPNGERVAVCHADYRNRG